MGYSIRTSNYPERITLYGLTHMVGSIDLVATCVETLKIYNSCFFEKEFFELICMNP